VKSADYAIEGIVGAKEILENGGDVKTVMFVKGHSSTSSIKRIIKHYSKM
jgi:bifunctional ADP-heptose synthase (sugar kinase/adenylyltransferase)